MTSQKVWCEALLDPDCPIPPGVVTRHGSDLAQRMAVYRNNVMASLTDALACTFPVTEQLVGEEFFRAMARDFIRKHPAQNPVLSHYGYDFSMFIRKFAPAASVPYLADIAQLEYLRIQALHAADAACLTTEKAQRWLGDTTHLDQMKFLMAPHVFSYQSEFAAVSVWAAHFANSGINLEDICLAQGESALIFRSDLNVMVLQVAPAIACFVDFLKSHCCFLDAAQAVDEKMGKGWELSQALALLLQHGLVEDIERSPQALCDDLLTNRRGS